MDASFIADNARPFARHWSIMVENGRAFGRPVAVHLRLHWNGLSIVL